MRGMSLERSEPSPSGTSGREEWALFAAGSGVLFTVAASAAFAVLFGGFVAVDELRGLQHVEPDTVSTSSSVTDALLGALLVAVVGFLYGSALALPVGIVVGIVNGALARRLRRHRRAAVLGVASVVGVLSGLVLPAALTRGLGLSWLGLPVGALAALAAGAHLRREQRRSPSRVDRGS